MHTHTHRLHGKAGNENYSPRCSSEHYQTPHWGFQAVISSCGCVTAFPAEFQPPSRGFEGGVTSGERRSGRALKPVPFRGSGNKRPSLLLALRPSASEEMPRTPTASCKVFISHELPQTLSGQLSGACSELEESDSTIALWHRVNAVVRLLQEAPWAAHPRATGTPPAPGQSSHLQIKMSV